MRTRGSRIIRKIHRLALYVITVQDVLKIQDTMHLGEKHRVPRRPAPRRVLLTFSGELVFPLSTLLFQRGCSPRQDSILKGTWQHPLVFGA